MKPAGITWPSVLSLELLHILTVADKTDLGHQKPPVALVGKSLYLGA